MFGPNITGEVKGSAGQSFAFGLSTSGAFYKGSSAHGASDHSSGSNAIAIDASRASATFGKATSVQPPSIRFLPCIKT